MEIFGHTVTFYKGHFPLKVANLDGPDTDEIEDFIGFAGGSRHQMQENGVWIMYYALNYGIHVIDVPGRNQKVVVLNTGAVLLVDGDNNEHVNAEAKGKFPVLKRFKPNFECDGRHLPKRVDNYHPIKKSEVDFFLTIARVAEITSRYRQVRNFCVDQVVGQVKIRLVQAISGIKCPFEIKGPVAARMNRLEFVYDSNIQAEGHFLGWNDEIWGLINGADFPKMHIS